MEQRDRFERADCRGCELAKRRECAKGCERSKGRACARCNEQLCVVALREIESTEESMPNGRSWRSI